MNKNDWYMRLLKRCVFVFSLLCFQDSYATNWYLDEYNILKNDDIPELTIANKEGVLLFYINHQKVKVTSKGKLAKIPISAALIDSVSNEDKICIEAVAGSNHKQQDIKNIYIIHHDKIKAFQTQKTDMTCASELNITQ